MNDSDFLRDLTADPHDDALRTVYADWLEERGDLRGEYLRLELDLAGLERSDPLYVPREERLRTLRLDLNEAWLAAAGKRYDVILVDFPREMTIGMIKILRSVVGMHMNDAVRLLHEAPSVIKSHIARAEAERICLQIETFYGGDTVSLRPVVKLQVSTPA